MNYDRTLAVMSFSIAFHRHQISTERSVFQFPDKHIQVINNKQKYNRYQTVNQILQLYHHRQGLGWLEIHAGESTDTRLNQIANTLRIIHAPISLNT